jgi:hypothetical protein
LSACSGARVALRGKLVGFALGGGHRDCLCGCGCVLGVRVRGREDVLRMALVRFGRKRMWLTEGFLDGRERERMVCDGRVWRMRGCGGKF